MNTTAQSELGPFWNRPAEFELYQPLIGLSMLELGGKINAPPEAQGWSDAKRRRYTYKVYFESLGFRHTSVDWNGENGALVMDLRKPLKLGTFSVVTNIGTTEHVDQQEPVWRNILDAMEVDSIFISTTPKPGQWKWHGLWYPTDAFYIELAELNGLEIERLYESGDDPRKMWFFRAKRTKIMPFVMPSLNLMFRNVP